MKHQNKKRNIVRNVSSPSVVSGTKGKAFEITAFLQLKNSLWGTKGDIRTKNSNRHSNNESFEDYYSSKDRSFKIYSVKNEKGIEFKLGDRVLTNMVVDGGSSNANFIIEEIKIIDGECVLFFDETETWKCRCLLKNATKA